MSKSTKFRVRTKCWWVIRRTKYRNATATWIVHVDATGGSLTLFVGTDVGLLTVETTLLEMLLLRIGDSTSPEPTLIATDIDELRTIGAG